ncbi:MAG: DNA polymerase [Nitrospinae bacterium]|nr:DNA polymerase [Nitrospinota bacterium]
MNSDIFYGTKGNRAADIMFVGESWGAEEAKQLKPFVGKSGELLDELISFAGYDPAECFFTNVVPEKPAGNEMSWFFHHPKQIPDGHPGVGGLHPHDNVRRGLENLWAQIEAVKPKLIIGLGNYTLWALTENSFSFDYNKITSRRQPTGITSWRGSQLKTSRGVYGYNFLPTYHPAATFHTYPWRGMIQHDLKFRSRRSWEEPNWDFTLRPSFQRTMATILHCQHHGGTIAVDIETVGRHIACLSLAWSRRAAICIPFMTTHERKHYWSAEEEVAITLALRKLLTSPNVKVVGQNFLFDAFYIFHDMLFRTPIADDTMIKHHTCFPGGGDPIKGTGPAGLPQKSLHHLASVYNDWYCYWKEEGKTWDRTMPEEQYWHYNCRDSTATFEVNEHETRVVEEQNLTEQYALQMKQVNKLALPIMLEGMKVDVGKRTQASFDLSIALDNYAKQLDPMLPEYCFERKQKGAPWYRSPTQMKEIFYDTFGVKPVNDRKTRKPTTNKEALQIIAKREPLLRPIVEHIETYRSLGVFYSTFTKARLSSNNRMRCSVNPAGTETFRWSTSQNPWGEGGNMQNLPEGDEEAELSTYGFPNVRKFYIPDTGCALAEFDMSGADAQVVAAEAEDTEMLDKLQAGVKLHAEASEEFFGTAKQPYYDACKRRIHATNYGGSAEAVHRALLGLYGSEYTSIQTEREFQAFWFDRHPGIRKWQKRVDQDIQTSRGVRNKFGNRILYFDRIENLLKEALAWIPQSTVGLNCVRGALKFQEEFPFAKVKLQVHDSVLVQFPRRYEHMLPKMAAMFNSLYVPYDRKLYIPWNCKWSIVSWGDAEPVQFN